MSWIPVLATEKGIEKVRKFLDIYTLRGTSIPVRFVSEFSSYQPGNEQINIGRKIALELIYILTWFFS